MAERPGSAPERRSPTSGEAGYRLVARLTGVPDGDASRFWDLWTGAAGPDKEARTRVLAALREAGGGEAATANLVTLAMRHLLLRVGRGDWSAPRLAVLLSEASDEQLSRWAADLEVFEAELSRHGPP